MSEDLKVLFIALGSLIAMSAMVVGIVYALVRIAERKR